MVAHPTHRFNEQFRGAVERPTEMVKEYPVSSMLVMFGIGLGVGVIVGQAISGTLHEMLDEPTMTEKVKRQAYDALSHVLSPSMLRQLQNYTHS